MLATLLLIVLFGLVALLLGFSRWLAHRPWAAVGNVGVGIALLAFAHAYWPAVLHLRTYEPLPREAMVAQVYCERTGPRSWRVTLTRLPGGRMQVYDLSGDQWRIDARTLVWKGSAAKLGVPSGYRFERLSARTLHADPVVATDGDSALQPPEGYPLGDAEEPGEDVWSQARAGQRWVGDVEPGRAYGPWRPLADKARFDVWMTHAPGTPDARLDARPGNEAGAQAMGYTRSEDDTARNPKG
jgi:hypothetical protein